MKTKFILSLITAFLFSFLGSMVLGSAVAVAGASELAINIVTGVSFTGIFSASLIPSPSGLAFGGLYTPIASGGNLRNVFNGIKQDYAVKEKSKGKPAPTITYSYLRSEVALGTTGSVAFPILTQDGTATVNERRLNISDDFVVTSLGLFIYKIASGAAVGNGILYTFPNSLVFSGSSEAANLQSIYNGSINVTVNRNEIIPALDCMQFYEVGTAQQSVLTAATGTGNSYLANQYSKEAGFAEVIPTFKLSGSAVNQVTLNLPASAALAGTSSTNYVALVARGFLIQGGASFN
jgi:hypothetical protein